VPHITIAGIESSEEQPLDAIMHAEKMEWDGLSGYVMHDLPAGKQPSLAVVLCHGFGAPGTDLVGLAEPLITTQRALAENAVFVFPAAPMDLTDRGLPGGRAWWWVDLDRLINRRTPEVAAEFRRECPPGLPQARTLVTAVIEKTSQQFGLATDRLVLGGFSQGAMLATDVALRLPTAPAALCVLSGALINEQEWRPLAMKRGPLTVLQSHGRYDSILPFPLAEGLRDLFVEAGAEVDFFPFNGDHEIPLGVLHRLADLLHRLAGG
jgi:phospholipase/carboxylesterase